MITLSFFRVFSVNCLLSLSKELLKCKGSITEEAVTGPAKQPLPASSQPHSKFSVNKKVLALNFFWQKYCFIRYCFSFMKFFVENYLKFSHIAIVF